MTTENKRPPHARALLCLAISTLVACAAPVPGNDSAMGVAGEAVVTTDEAAGVLARIDYPRHDASIEFLDAGEDGVMVAGSHPVDGFDPLAAGHVQGMLPVEAFITLTGQTPPRTLIDAEDRALATGARPMHERSPEPLAAPDGVAVSASALTSSQFRDRCAPKAEVCVTRRVGNQTFKSGSRRVTAKVLVNAVKGAIRVRVQKHRAIRGWKTMGSSLTVRQGQTMNVYWSIGNWVQKTLRVVVDEASNNTWHLGVDFTDASIVGSL